MKKLLVLLTACAFTFTLGVVAQDNKMQDTKSDTKMVHKMNDKVMMKDGKMWTMKDGKTMEMTAEMTMKDGTKVMTDGTVIKKDGTKMVMKNGDAVDMNGKMWPMKKSMGEVDPAQVK